MLINWIVIKMGILSHEFVAWKGKLQRFELNQILYKEFTKRFNREEHNKLMKAKEDELHRLNANKKRLEERIELLRSVAEGNPQPDFAAKVVTSSESWKRINVAGLFVKPKMSSGELYKQYRKGRGLASYRTFMRHIGNNPTLKFSWEWFGLRGGTTRVWKVANGKT